MGKERNHLMHWITGGVILLAILINVLGRYFHLFDFSHGIGKMVTSSEIEAQYGLILNLLLLLPIVFYIISLVLYRQNKQHPHIPYLLTLALTFASIAIISGGSGRVEFHFSIFMVVAALGYYQNIKLVLLMTVIFGLQHIIGLIYVPEIVFGVESYMFSMFLWHAIFLTLTSSAVSWQVYSNRNIEAFYQEKQKKQRKDIIEEIVGRLSTTTSQISTLSNDLSNNTKNSYETSGQLAAAMEQVSSSINKQLEIIQENTKTINQINEGIKSINETARNAAENSNASAEDARHGSELINNLLSKMKEINENVNESYHKVKELLQHSHSIKGIIDVISDIADQTNLLALNASIEAARAGENGKGFAVVADEIRKLAEQSLKSATNISDIIQQILTDTDGSVKAMENVKQSTTEGLETAEKSNKVFHDIAETSSNVASQIQGVSSLTEDLAYSSIEVNSSMNNIIESAQQSAAGTKEGMLSSDRQHELTELTFDVSQKLNNLTTELEGVILTLQSEMK